MLVSRDTQHDVNHHNSKRYETQHTDSECLVDFILNVAFCIVVLIAVYAEFDILNYYA
jgi:hypothetical protein